MGGKGWSSGWSRTDSDENAKHHKCDPALENHAYVHTLYWFNYLTIFVSHTSSINCSRLQIVSSTFIINYIQCTWKKVFKLQSLKSCQILCAHKHCFLMPGHKCGINSWLTSGWGLAFGENSSHIQPSSLLVFLVGLDYKVLVWANKQTLCDWM